MRITLNGVCLIIASIILILYSLRISSLELLSISLLLLLIAWKSYREVKGYGDASKHIEVSRKISRPYVEEGDHVEVSIEVRNNSDRYIQRVEIEDIIPTLARPVESPVAGVSLPPKYIADISYTLELTSPGRYDFSTVFLRLEDPLGIFVEEIAAYIPGSAVAIPEPAAFRETLEIASRSPGTWMRGKSFGGLYDFYGMRDYQYGDDARKIMWSVYARTRKLLVREDLTESRGRVVIIIDIPAVTWELGVPPRSVAEDLARISRGVIETMVRNYNVVDAVICEEYAARIIRGIWSGYREAIYTLYSNLKHYSGCESSYILYNSLKYIDIGPVHMAILITSPLGLAYSDPEELVETMSMISKNIYVLLYNPSSIDSTYTRNFLEETIPMLTSIGWRVIAIQGITS